MKIGITGLANSGKSTVFNSLTGLGVETPAYATTGGEPHVGMVKVPDERIDRLSAMFSPKKTTYSTVEFVDYVGLTRGDAKQNRTVLEFVKDADALVVVVRAFEDEAVVHPLGGVDPVRDVRAVETELILADMELIERRIENIELQARKGKKPPESERALLERCREWVEGERPLREHAFTPDDLAAMRHLQFSSIKPLTVAINFGEQGLGTDAARETEEAVRAAYRGGERVQVLSLSGKIEQEIAELDAAEARAFLDDLGIEEPARTRLIRAAYASVGLISFFTVGEDEVRAWAIRAGTTALGAAGKIHSDIERGFIRAEVVSYADFVAAGSVAHARDKGTFRLEGKTYTVADGDIINFRFNV
jgi:hypothetical protein